MIIALVQAADKQQQELEQLRIARDEAKVISEMLSTLADVEKSAWQLTSLYALARASLQNEDVQGFAADMSKLAGDITVSREKLPSEHRQVPQLNAVLKKMKALVTDIESAWKKYATEQVTPSLELLRLVLQLPEVRSQEQEFQDLSTQLQRFISQPPLNATSLSAFDNTLQELKQRLTRLEGLNAEVRTFLFKVQNGTATLSDMTEEVYQWCRQAQHASAFQVRIA
jgi:DNA repair ATPase RecN